MTKCSYFKRLTNELADGFHDDVPEFQVIVVKGTNRKEITYHCPFDAKQNSEQCWLHDRNMSGLNKQIYIDDLIKKAITNSLPLVCIGFYLSDVKIDNNKFKKAYFLHCSFSSTVLFVGVSFDEVYFNHAKFTQRLFLPSVEFRGLCDFSNVRFENDINFLSSCKFIGKTKFSGAHFVGSAHFRNVTFAGEVIFAGAVFYYLADFSNTKLRSSSSFYGSQFREAEFSYVKFYGPVTFDYSKFTGFCNYFEAQFNEMSSFSYVTFDKVDFDKAKLLKAQFNRCEFRNEVTFGQTLFPYVHELWFDWFHVTEEELKHILHNMLGFQWLTDNQTKVHNLGLNNMQIVSGDSKQKVILKIGIGSKVSIITPNGKISDTFYVKKSNNNRYLYKLNIIGKEINDIPVRFDYSSFNQKVKFVGKPDEHLNLGLVSFKGVDLGNFEFHNVDFMKTRFRNMIIDEKFLSRNRNYFEVSRIYNQLRKNYETELAFNEASNFFIGEMDVTRRSLLSGNAKQKFSSFGYLAYKILALYGESASLPLLVWTPIVIIIFTLLRYSFNFCSTITTTDECSSVDRWIDSIAAFFQIPRSLGGLDVAERIISAPILGAAFIAVRRKFERKK